MMQTEDTPTLALGIEGELRHQPQLKIGLIGCGSHAFRNILPVIQYLPDARLQACCDLKIDKARAYAATFGADAAYGNIADMVDKSPLDCVIVVVGFSRRSGRPLYPSIVAELLDRDIPVWFEKPPAATEQEIVDLKKHERPSVFAQVGFKKMFAPATERVRDLVQLDEFGGLASYTYRYGVDLPQRPDDLLSPSSRRFLDDFIHVASVIVDIAGLPSQVTSFRTQTGDGFVVLEHANGVVGTVHLSAGASGLDSVEEAVFVGHGANVRIQNGIDVEYYPPGWRGPYGRSTSYFPQPLNGSPPSVTDGPRRWIPEFSLGTLSSGRHFVQGYYQELAHFISCVATHRPPVRAGLEDARRAMALVDAVKPPFGITKVVSSAPPMRARPNHDTEMAGIRAPICERTRLPFTLKDGWNYVCENCGSTSTQHEDDVRACPVIAG